jgi:hypothetical protein
MIIGPKGSGNSLKSSIYIIRLGHIFGETNRKLERKILYSKKKQFKLVKNCILKNP